MNTSLIIPDVDCSFGAPMGRTDRLDYNGEALAILVVQIDSQGYDAGGSYWGVSNTPLWVAVSDDHSVRMFAREESKNAAMAVFAAMAGGDLVLKDAIIDPENVDPAALHPVLSGFIDYAIVLEGEDAVRSQAIEADGDDEGDHILLPATIELSERTLRIAARACAHFVTDAADDIAAVTSSSSINEVQIGNDLYLTWSGSGASFMDRDTIDEDLRCRLMEKSRSGSLDLELARVEAHDEDLTISF